MQTVLRRVRAVAVTALMWSVGWAVTGAILRLVWPFEVGGRAATLWVMLGSGLDWMLPGAISGTVYAIIVMAAAPRRIEEMSVARMTILGALGGGVLPVILTAAWSLSSSPLTSFGWSIIPRYALAGAVCGAVSLLLARRGPSDGGQAMLPREDFPSMVEMPAAGVEVKVKGTAPLVAFPTVLTEGRRIVQTPGLKQHRKWVTGFVLVLGMLGLTTPLAAQLPAGYAEGPAVLLPDTLHEVSGGGTFRIRIERAAANAFEREIIERAERLMPPSAAIDTAIAVETRVRGRAPAPVVRERAGPRWWWFEAHGTLVPYALTGDAVAHVIERVREFSREPLPSYFQAGWEHEVYATYHATVEPQPTPNVAYRVHMKLDFFIACGGRCGYGFVPTRTVDFDAAGNVVAVNGDGRIVQRYR